LSCTPDGERNVQGDYKLVGLGIGNMIVHELWVLCSICGAFSSCHRLKFSISKRDCARCTAAAEVINWLCWFGIPMFIGLDFCVGLFEAERKTEYS